MPVKRRFSGSGAAVRTLERRLIQIMRLYKWADAAFDQMSRDNCRASRAACRRSDGGKGARTCDPQMGGYASAGHVKARMCPGYGRATCRAPCCRRRNYDLPGIMERGIWTTSGVIAQAIPGAKERCCRVHGKGENR